jgi:hypothetical protein
VVVHGKRLKTEQLGAAEQFAVFNKVVAKAADFFNSSELV